MYTPARPPGQRPNLTETETMEQTQTQSEKPFTGEMAIMGREGDTKIMWDKTKPVEVDVARSNFEKLRKEGYSAYAVSDKGDKKGETVREFDPNAERYVFVPPMQAG